MLTKKKCYTFQKSKNYVQKCVTFATWILQKSDATLLHVFKNTTLLQRSAVSTQGLSLKAILVRSTTASVYYKEIVQSSKRMSHHFMQCVRYSFKRVLHPLRTFLTGKTLSKYCCIYWSILLQRNVTCSQRNLHNSLNSVCFQFTVSVFGLSGKVCGKNKDVGGMSHCSGTQWLKRKIFNLDSLDSRFKMPNWGDRDRHWGRGDERRKAGSSHEECYNEHCARAASWIGSECQDLHVSST